MCVWNEYSLPLLEVKCAEYPIVGISRVLVLDNRCLRGAVNELIRNRTLLLRKEYTWMARAVLQVLSPRPGGRLWLSGARIHGCLQLEIC
jgi:hypothetical protein